MNRSFFEQIAHLLIFGQKTSDSLRNQMSKFPALLHSSSPAGNAGTQALHTSSPAGDTNTQALHTSSPAGYTGTQDSNLAHLREMLAHCRKCWHTGTPYQLTCRKYWHTGTPYRLTCRKYWHSHSVVIHSSSAQPHLK